MNEPNKTKVVFMGTSPFALSILESLFLEKYDIVGVYTQPGEKSLNDENSKPTEVEEFCQKNNLRVFEIERFDQKKAEELSSLKPDVIVVAAYGKILPQSVLEIPSLGCLNVHPSLLPKFRGPSPIQNTLLSGEKETGTTIILMDKGVDTGDILAQEKVVIGPEETVSELSEKLAKVSAELLEKTLPLWVEKKITPVPQDNSQATLCQLIEREDGKVIWDDDAVSIYNRWRAFLGWPGIYAFWERGEKMVRVKFKKISLSSGLSPSGHLGEVFRDEEGVKVVTGSGSIVVHSIQIEGKNEMTIEEFLNGYSDFIGAVLR